MIRSGDNAQSAIERAAKKIREMGAGYGEFGRKIE